MTYAVLVSSTRAGYGRQSIVGRRGVDGVLRVLGWISRACSAGLKRTTGMQFTLWKARNVPIQARSLHGSHPARLE